MEWSQKLDGHERKRENAYISRECYVVHWNQRKINVVHACSSLGGRRVLHASCGRSQSLQRERCRQTDGQADRQGKKKIKRRNPLFPSQYCLCCILYIYYKLTNFFYCRHWLRLLTLKTAVLVSLSLTRVGMSLLLFRACPYETLASSLAAWLLVLLLYLPMNHPPFALLLASSVFPVLALSSVVCKFHFVPDLRTCHPSPLSTVHSTRNIEILTLAKAEDRSKISVSNIHHYHQHPTHHLPPVS